MPEIPLPVVLCLCSGLLYWSAPLEEQSAAAKRRRAAGFVMAIACLLTVIIFPFLDKPAIDKPAYPTESDELLEKVERAKAEFASQFLVISEYRKHPQEVPAGHYSLIVEIPIDFNAEMLRELLPLKMNNLHEVVLEHSRDKFRNRYDGLDEAYAIGKKEAFQKLGLKAEVIPLPEKAPEVNPSGGTEDDN